MDRKKVDSETIAALRKAVEQTDLRTGRAILDKVADECGYEALVIDVFEPLLTEMGEKLKRKEIPLAQTYMFSTLADQVMQSYETSAKGKQHKDSPKKGLAVVANIEDDCHPLGRKIVATMLRIHNWEVCDLGIDVEASEIVDKAIEIGANVIGVSAMIFSTAENIKKVRQEIDARGYKGRILLAVGGAVFRLRPDLAEEVGADGTSPNALSALALFDDLQERARKVVSL